MTEDNVKNIIEKYLKDNLEVEVSKTMDTSFSSVESLHVSLVLDGEQIAEDSDYLE